MAVKDTGWLDLTTFTNTNQGTGSLAWSSPANAASSDDSDATATVNSIANNVHTQYLRGVNLSGLSLPPLVWIRGVEVRYERALEFSLSGVAVLQQARLMKSGSVVGDDKGDGTSFPSTGDAYDTLGSSTDLWGTTLTQADVEDANFGVGIAAALWAPVDPGWARAHIDHIQMKIHYENKDEMFLTV